MMLWKRGIYTMCCLLLALALVTQIGFGSRGSALTEEEGKIIVRHDIRVHRWITRQAVKFLKDRTTDQALIDELDAYVEKLVDGAEDEDTAPRWLNHFYRPTDGRGYYLPDLDFKA